jgi:hypothetical protein
MLVCIMAMLQSEKTQLNLSKEKKGGNLLNSKVIMAALFLIALIAIGASGYFYFKNQQLLKDPAKAGQKELQAVVKNVDKLILLPQGEQPTLATVTDKDKLKDQTFFVNAEVGDKVLIYTTAKKAYLYRPSANKLIEVAPLNITQNDGTSQNDSGTTPVTTATPTEAPRQTPTNPPVTATPTVRR